VKKIFGGLVKFEKAWVTKPDKKIFGFEADTVKKKSIGKN
jgi:hypothetical protein